MKCKERGKYLAAHTQKYNPIATASEAQFFLFETVVHAYKRIYKVEKNKTSTCE